MLQFEELRLKLQGMEPELRELKQSLNIDKLGIEIAELERKAAEPSFWDDMENSQKVLQRTSQLKASVETYNKLQALYEDTLTLIELAEEAGDESVYEEAAADTEQLQTRMAEVRLTTLLTGEYDSKNAILTFHAGAGGTEAQDWAQMLYRMYTRWAERHGYSYKILDYLDGDEAGIKSASILIEGMNAYGFLKVRKRRAPPGACFSLRCQRPPADLLCLAGGHAGNRQGCQYRDPRGGHPDGCVPCQRGGRAEGQ